MTDEQVLLKLNQLTADLAAIKAEIVELRQFKFKVELELDHNWADLHKTQQITNDKIDVLNNIIGSTFNSLSQTLNYVIAKMEAMPMDGTKLS